MAGRVTIEDKVGSWYTAFHAVRAELTTKDQREEARYPEAADVRRTVAANDRTAALVAALLIGSGGTRPIPTDALEDV